jgi:hypothetical protein
MKTYLFDFFRKMCPKVSRLPASANYSTSYSQQTSLLALCPIMFFRQQSPIPFLQKHNIADNSKEEFYAPKDAAKRTMNLPVNKYLTFDKEADG